MRFRPGLLRLRLFLIRAVQDERLSREARAAIHRPDAELLVSAVGVWECLLIAQAKLEGRAIVTRDPAFPVYGIPIVW